MEKRSTVDNTMILFDRVTKTYGTGQKALDDVSLQIEKGEFVFLVGNSGAGKTTLLELILRETEADQGNIVVNGIDLRQLKERQVCRYRRYIGMVFQDFCLFPDFTVYENVETRVGVCPALAGIKYEKNWTHFALTQAPSPFLIYKRLCAFY